MILHRDYETRSTVDLRKVGVHVYAEHPTTDVWVAVFILEDDAGKLGGPIIWYPGEEIPDEVFGALNDPRVTIAGHNAAFEQTIDRHIMGPRYGFPIVPDSRIDCTMARAAIQAIPLDLAGACNALNLRYQKDAAGHRLMLQMCRPRRIEDNGTVVWWDDPAKRQRLTDYCTADVLAEAELGRVLRPMQAIERPVWQLDQTINNRGVYIDAEFVRLAERVVVEAGKRADAEMRRVTGGAVEKASQVERLKEFAKSHGVEFKLVEKVRRNGEEYEAEAADREALEDLLAGDLPEPVRLAFQIRLDAGKSSVKKLAKFRAQMCGDGRARGNLQYHAATPGRWAGRGIQLQNLVRKGISEYGGWAAAHRDLRDLDLTTFDLVWGSPLDVVSRMLRGAVVAAPGCKLIFGDYSNVEARGCVWSAKQDDQVELFASGGLIYEEMASAIFDISVEEVLELHKSKRDIIPRFVGKETVLGCGYGMGPAAFKRNCKKKGKVVLDEGLCYRAVHGWRDRNHRVVDFWREIEDAAKAAIDNPGKVFWAGPFAYRRPHPLWLQCRLPSGRVIWYRRPSLKPASEDLEQLDEG